MVGVWSGLADSRFVRDGQGARAGVWRLLGSVVGGAVVAAVAAVAVWCLTMAGVTAALGLAPEGLQGLGEAAQRLVDPAVVGAPIQVARLLVTSAVDGGALLVFAAFAVAALHEPLHRSVTAAPRIRWRLALTGGLLALIILAPLAVAERRFASDGPIPILTLGNDLGQRLAYAGAALLLIPAAAAEELVFRGWVLRRVASFQVPTSFLILGTGLAFSALHFDFNPDAFLMRAIMGCGFAYMTLRLGGIEFSSGVHAAHNMLIVLYLEPISLRTQASPISPLSLMTDLSLIVGYFIITEAVVHAPLLRRLAGVRLDELSPPDNQTGRT